MITIKAIDAKRRNLAAGRTAPTLIERRTNATKTMKTFLIALCCLLPRFPAFAADAVPVAPPDKPVIRVACVGDSITAITGYPKHLAALLSQPVASATATYEVGNFGVSGSTALRKSEKPYM